VVDAQKERELFGLMAAKRNEYLRLTNQYDRILSEVHHLPHGSPELREALLAAREVGVEVAEALRQYQEVLQSLAALYQEHATPSAAGGQPPR
jgi:hypothetical protein